MDTATSEETEQAARTARRLIIAGEMLAQEALHANLGLGVNQ
jgi:hypothetical protein